MNEQSTETAQASGKNCDRCGQELPLRDPLESESPRKWICVACHNVVNGILITDATKEFRDKLRPTAIAFSDVQNDTPSAELKELIDQIIDHNYDGAERRTIQRHRYHSSSMIVPLDEQFRPKGEVVAVGTLDISAGGMAFVHNEPMHDKLFAVQLAVPDGRKIQVVMKVVRSRPISEGYHEIGGQFVTKMGI